MKNKKELRYAYLDENDKPILTEGHTGQKIDDLSKEDLIFKLRVVEKLLEKLSDDIEQLSSDSKEVDTYKDYIIETLEYLSEDSCFALAYLRRTNQ